MSLPGSLRNDDVHVWKMDVTNPAWDAFSGVLDQSEREQAARFRIPRLQRQYCRCHSALRLILARYARQSAADLRFTHGKFGKPDLSGHAGLCFNLSHSGDYALVAVATQMVGIDLEYMAQPRTDLQGLIETVCHPSEQTMLAALPQAEKLATFYRLWAQKEAYCKMRGLGLQQSLPALYFTAVSASAWQVFAGDATASSACFAHTLNLFDTYASSVCLPLADPRIALFDA